MSDGVVDSLVLDLLEWIDPNPRPYDEVLEVWRTSCPRLPVWEEPNDRGFLVSISQPGHGRLVSISADGREHLRQRRPRPRFAVNGPTASEPCVEHAEELITRSAINPGH
jgi:hypothetical protein